MSVNLTNTNDSTPLHLSAQFGHIDATKTLVESGADINKTDCDGNTPLMVAANNGKFNILFTSKIGANTNMHDA